MIIGTPKRAVENSGIKMHIMYFKLNVSKLISWLRLIQCLPADPE